MVATVTRVVMSLVFPILRLNQLAMILEECRPQLSIHIILQKGVR